MLDITGSLIEDDVESHTWERRSPRPEDDHLLAHTQNWMMALPKGVRPVHLAAGFPRIVNELSRLWDETAALDTYFEEKEFSARTDRDGFPPHIQGELLVMRIYSLRSRPVAYEARAPLQRSLRA